MLMTNITLKIKTTLIAFIEKENISVRKEYIYIFKSPLLHIYLPKTYFYA